MFVFLIHPLLADIYMEVLLLNKIGGNITIKHVNILPGSRSCDSQQGVKRCF